MDKRYLGILQMVVAALLWSTGGLLIKLTNLNAFAIAGGRSAIACLLMVIYLRKPVRLKSREGIYGTIAYAVLLIGFVVANKLTTSANAILLQFTAPIWVALFSIKLLKEKPDRVDIATILIVTMGMLLFFLGDINIGNMLGNLIAVFSGIAMALMIIYMKSYDGEAIDIALIGNLVVAVVCIPSYFATMPTYKDIIAILVLGTLQLGLSYILYTMAIKHVSAIDAVLIPVLEPLLNPIWVFLFTKESPGITALIGGIIILVSVVFNKIIKLRQENNNYT